MYFTVDDLPESIVSVQLDQLDAGNKTHTDSLFLCALAALPTFPFRAGNRLVGESAWDGRKLPTGPWHGCNKIIFLLFQHVNFILNYLLINNCGNLNYLFQENAEFMKHSEVCSDNKMIFISF